VNQDIVELLDTYHYRALHRMAEIVGFDPDLGKDDLVAEMAANYFTERRIRASLMRLDEGARAVLDRLRQLGGEMATHRLREQLLDEGLVEDRSQEKGFFRNQAYGFGAPYADGGYVGKVSRGDSLVFEDVMARLALQGLVFSRDAGTSYSGTPYKVRLHPGAIVYVPEAVARHLPDPGAPLPSMDEWEPDQVELGTPDLLLRDLYLTWDLVRRSDVRLNKSGFVSKPSLRGINQALLVPDATLERASREDETTRLHLLCRLLENLDLVRRTDGLLRAIDAEGSLTPAFWARPLTEQVMGCLDAWEDIIGPADTGMGTGEPRLRYAEARRMLRATLARFEPETWLETEDVVEAVQREHEDFLLSGRYGMGRLGGSPLHRSYAHSTDPDTRFLRRFELTFVERCLRGFLHETGVVALGYEGDRVRAFKVTEVGQAALSGQLPPDSAGRSDGAGKVVVQPTFDVIAMGPVGLDTLARLDVCAERQRADRAVFEYRLSRASLDEARQRGVTAAQVVAFLERKSETGLPQNVRRSLEGWASAQERIVFRSGVNLLETAAPDELQALMNDADVGRHLSRPVAPTVALVGDGRRDGLVAALTRRGSLPVISGAERASADDSVIVHEDGLIEAAHAVPGFQVRSRLEKLAEPDGDGTWRLTPASVRRAGGSRERVLDLLDELWRLHRGQLPEAVIRWIKAEGRYYGSANTETLTLIAFRDRQALEELREKDPELTSLLMPFEAGDRALAVVPTGRLSDVRERLAAFGVQVREERISGT